MFERWSASLREIPVTWGLVTLHLFLYLYTSSVDPMFGREALMGLGAQHNPSVWDGDYYRLIVCGFLHGGWFHFLLNNLALISLGRLLERLLGSAGFGFAYLISLLAGNIASLIWMPPAVVSVGASGAIMGLAGALCTLLLFDRRGRFLVASPSGRLLFFGLVLLQFLIGKVFPFINNAAHLGGFLAGACFGVFFWSRIPGGGLPRNVGAAALIVCLSTMGTLTYVGLTPQGGYAWHFHKGTQAFQSKDVKKAPKNFLAAEKALLAARKAKETPEVLYLLGELYVQTEQFKKAASVFDALIKRVTHQDQKTWYGYLWSLLDASPNRSAYWYGYLRALGKSGQKKKAKAALAQALKHFLTKKSGGGLSGYLLGRRSVPPALLRARMYAAALEDRKAILLYQELLKEHSGNAFLHNEYAWLLATAHDPRYRSAKQAVDYANFAVRRSPNAAFLDTQARAYFLAKDYKKAVAIQTRAINSLGAAETMPHLLFHLRRFQKALKASQPASRPAPRKRVAKRKRALPQRRAAPRPAPVPRKRAAATSRPAPPSPRNQKAANPPASRPAARR